MCRPEAGRHGSTVGSDRTLLLMSLVRWRDWCGGIAVRSALVSAVEVLAGLLIVGSASAVLLYRVMCADVDNAATARAQAVADVLGDEAPEEVESVLLATDHRVVAVQIADAAGTVIRRSDGAPKTPLIPLQGNGSRVGVLSPGDDDVRVSTITVSSRAGGPFTVLVGGGIEPI